MIYALEGGIVLTRCQNNLSPAARIRGASNKSALLLYVLYVCVRSGVYVHMCRWRAILE
jgi:hypothetical protein